MDRRGFTLVELLTFIAIFTIAVAGFITIFITIIRVQSRQSSSLDVQSQGQFVIQQIQYYVQTSRLIDMAQDASSTVLKLRVATSSLDPTSITLSTGTLYLQQGTTGTLQALTSNKVTVSNLSFIRRYNANTTSSAFGRESLYYSFTMAASTTNTTMVYSRQFQSAVSVFAPVPKIALIQKFLNETGSGGVTSVTSTYASANATGSLLLAVISNTGSSTVTSSVADTAGNTWTKVANPQLAAYNQETTVFAALNAKNATNTVTATFGAGVSAPSLFIFEYRGAATSSSLTASSTQLAVASGTPSSGSVSATSGVQLAVGVLYSNPSSEIPNAGSDYTLEATSSNSATYIEDQTLYVDAPLDAPWAYPTITPTSSALIVTFK